VVEVEYERWFCPRHRHLAQPGDLEEHQPPYVGLSATGKPIPSAKERARIEAWNRERMEEEERVRRGREERARREGEAIEEAKQRFADEGEISVLGIRTRPDLRVIK
jgi:hypothetical protein